MRRRSRGLSDALQEPLGVIPYLLGTTHRERGPVYVREKTTTRGDKTYSYFQLVEGERVDGRVRQKVVKHLGRYSSRDHADYVARRRGLLCSALACGRRGTQEHNLRGERIRLCEEHAAAYYEEGVRGYPLF